MPQQHSQYGQPTCEMREQEQRERRERARRSLSGSCAGDYSTANTVKEKPRRQPTSSRLSMALRRGERGLRPPVCAHGPLNDYRALPHLAQVCPVHSTSISHGRIAHRKSFRNRPIGTPGGTPPGAAAPNVMRRERIGTSRRPASFR